MIVRNWKKYYTLEEAKVISDKRIEKMWDRFIEKIKQKRVVNSWKKSIKKVFNIWLKVENYA